MPRRLQVHRALSSHCRTTLPLTLPFLFFTNKTSSAQAWNTSYNTLLLHMQGIYTCSEVSRIFMQRRSLCHCLTCEMPSYESTPRKFHLNERYRRYWLWIECRESLLAEYLENLTLFLKLLHLRVRNFSQVQELCRILL